LYYKIVEKFGPESGGRWQGYLEWRGLELERFDSVDGILRPDLFIPDSAEDWKNCVNEENRTSLITDLEYTLRILDRYEDPLVIGVEIGTGGGYVPEDGLLGFDIVDGDGCISLVTNWGTDEEDIINKHVMSNGLIGSLGTALRVRDVLRENFPEDGHAETCEVWAVYQVTK
jgi:hypothetical protein